MNSTGSCCSCSWDGTGDSGLDLARSHGSGEEVGFLIYSESRANRMSFWAGCGQDLGEEDEPLSWGRCP